MSWFIEFMQLLRYFYLQMAELLSYELLNICQLFNLL